MKLTENYSIEFDENNAILVHQETKESEKKGFYVVINRYYYPNLKTCLNAFIQKDLHGSTTVLNVINRLDELEVIILKLSK